MAKSQRKRVTFEFPIRGVDRSQPLYRQPPFTTFDSLNLIPRAGVALATGDGRRSGGPRMPIASRVQTDGAATVRRLHWCVNPANTAQSRIIAVAAGTISNISQAGFTYSSTLLAAGALSNVNPIHSADINGHVFLVDGGANIKDVDCNTLAVGNLALSAGLALPANVTLACNFMGRLVLSGQAASPQNIYMSRALVPGDFDYSQTDVLAAVALNASSSIGRIGNPVVALIPMSADRLLIACRDAMFILEGNPADGGRIRKLCDGIGIVGKDAYCVTPDGSVYFFGGNDLYVISPDGGQPIGVGRGRINHILNDFGALLNASKTTMAWDEKHSGILMQIGLLYAVFYTVGAEDGFFPMNYPRANGWLSILSALNDAYPVHVMMLGHNDGYIYIIPDTANGSQSLIDNYGVGDFDVITGYCWFGPVRPWDEAAAILTKTHLWIGDDNGTANSLGYEIYAGKSEAAILKTAPPPSAAVSGDYSAVGTSGYRQPLHHRVRGQVFALKLNNHPFGLGLFNLQSVAMDFEFGGTTR
jgi:hypothetical protein